MREPPPGLGLSWSVVRLAGGGQLGCWVFKCVRCERDQSYAPASQAGGVDKAEAQKLGWIKTRGVWVCPFCDPHRDDD